MTLTEHVAVIRIDFWKLKDISSPLAAKPSAFDGLNPYYRQNYQRTPKGYLSIDVEC